MKQFYGQARSAVTLFYQISIIGLGLLLFSTTASANEAGAAIYKKHCDGCHGGGFIGWLSGAPETGEAEEWKPFLAKGVETVKANAIKGVGRMDPKGGCDTCSNEEVEAAVDFILSQTPK